MLVPLTHFVDRSDPLIPLGKMIPTGLTSAMSNPLISRTDPNINFRSQVVWNYRPRDLPQGYRLFETVAKRTLGSQWGIDNLWTEDGAADGGKIYTTSSGDAISLADPWQYEQGNDTVVYATAFKVTAQLPWASALFYLKTDSSDIPNYQQVATSSAGTSQDDSVSLTSSSGDVLIKSFAFNEFDYPLTRVDGTWGVDVFRYVSSDSGTTRIRARIYRRNFAGIETQIASGLSADIQSLSAAVETISCLSSDTTEFDPASERIIVKLYALTTNATNITVHLVYNSPTHYSRVTCATRPGGLFGLGGTTAKFYISPTYDGGGYMYARYAVTSGDPCPNIATLNSSSYNKWVLAAITFKRNSIADCNVYLKGGQFSTLTKINASSLASFNVAMAGFNQVYHPAGSAMVGAFSTAACYTGNNDAGRTGLAEADIEWNLFEEEHECRAYAICGNRLVFRCVGEVTFDIKINGIWCNINGQALDIGKTNRSFSPTGEHTVSSVFAFSEIRPVLRNTGLLNADVNAVLTYLDVITVSEQYHISSSGVDDSDPTRGSEAAPYASLLYASNLRGGGQTYTFSDGLYAPQQILYTASGTETQPTVINCLNKWRAVFKGTKTYGECGLLLGEFNNISQETGVNWVVVDGLQTTECGFSGIFIQGSNCIIRNCWSHHNTCVSGRPGPGYGAGSGFNSHRGGTAENPLRWRNNIWEFNLAEYNGTTDYDHGFYCDGNNYTFRYNTSRFNSGGGFHTRIEDGWSFMGNLSYGNGHSGVYCEIYESDLFNVPIIVISNLVLDNNWSNNASATQIALNRQPGFVLRNPLIIGNNICIQGEHVESVYGSIIVSPGNNCLNSNGDYADRSWPVGTTISHNMVTTDFYSLATYPHNNTMIGEPTFVDPSIGNFRPTANSLSRGAGLLVYRPPLNLDGSLRTDNPPDLGPYQYRQEGWLDIDKYNTKIRIALELDLDDIDSYEEYIIRYYEALARSREE
jgi:hypothetical protein